MSTRFYPNQADYIAQLNGMDDQLQAAGAPTKASIGLGNVDNTSDVNKPLSTADTAALALKQDTSAKDASGGYAGLTLYKLNLRNAANTFTSFLTNTNNTSRTYTLPDASGTVALTADIPAAYTLPASTTTILGGIKIGTGLSIDGAGVVTVNGATVPTTASASTLGQIRVGSGLAIDGSGILSTTGAGTVTTVNSISPTAGNVVLTSANIGENTNLYFTAARAIASALTGLSTATATAVAAADSILVGIGKLQAQVTANLAAAAALAGAAFTGAVSIATTLAVTGAATLASTLGVAGILTVAKFVEAKTAITASVVAVTGTTTLPISAATANAVIKLTLDVSTILAFPAPGTGTGLFGFTLEVINSAAALSLTFPTVKWDGGAMPTRTTAINAVDWWYFWTEDNGATWQGTLSSKDSK